MAILGLGYIGIGASDIPAWRTFASGVLGTQVADSGDGGLKLRLDTRDWRIAVDPNPADDLIYVGWEVAGAEALEAVVAKIEASGTAVVRDGGTLAKKRGVLGVVSFTDPSGIASEIFWGATERKQDPFVSPAGVSGFVTGTQGLGHIVLGVANLAAVDSFYRDILGFRLSDRVDMEVMPGFAIPITFMHCNPRHHSFAFAPGRPGSPQKLIHFMLQTAALDDVGFALDRCAAASVPLAMTLGRHANDHMVSFYAYTPSGFEVEYGWGAVEIDDTIWTASRMDQISMWGHRRIAPPPSKS